MDSFNEPQFIHINGICLEVFTAGDPKHQPIILCHGFPELAYSWRYLVQPLVDKQYFLIMPNQRAMVDHHDPNDVEQYGIEYLTSDMVALLQHFDYDKALFIGHDMGAIVVWNLAMMYPERVSGLVNLSVPFMERGSTEWVGFWEHRLGGDFYIVHFNRQAGVADQVFKRRNRSFLRNFYRKNQWLHPKPELEGMSLIAIANQDAVPGDPIMRDEELEVFINAFKHSDYSGGINWYRNFSQNWRVIGEYEQIVRQPAMLIYGEHDMVPAPKDDMIHFVPDVKIHKLPCGHWIQQEMPDEVISLTLPFLDEHRTMRNIG